MLHSLDGTTKRTMELHGSMTCPSTPAWFFERPWSLDPVCRCPLPVGPRTHSIGAQLTDHLDRRDAADHAEAFEVEGHKSQTGIIKDPVRSFFVTFVARMLRS